MTCEEIRARLSEYLDGECEKSDEVAKHLESCPECKNEFEKLVTLSKSFENFVEENEKSLADSVVAKIRQEKMKKTPFFVRHIGLAASLVIILVIAVYTRFSPYDAKEESAEIGEPVGETVTLEAEILDIKNSAELKGDFNFALSDTSPVEEAEEAVTESVTADKKNEAPSSPSPEYSYEYTFLSKASMLIETLSFEFEIEQIDEATFLIKTDNEKRVKEIVGDTCEVFLENGVVVVKLK